MEWCEKIYGEFITADEVRRLERVVAVLILLVAAIAGIEEGEIRFSRLALQYPVEMDEGMSGNVREEKSAAKSVPVSAMDRIVPGDGADIAENVSEKIQSPEHTVSESAASTVSRQVIPEKLTPAVTETADPILPEDGNTQAFPMEEFPAADIPEEDVPAADIPEVSVPGNGLENINGFFVDTSGMICGVADTDVISEGYLILPAEECSGIRAFAFADVPAPITEIYIPANITRIEEGAFACLGCLEWLESEGSDTYFTEDGVLFSESGTCILGFPSARTGNYKVPRRVTRFATDAFSGARIEILDAVGCGLSDTGNLPVSIQLLLTEDLTADQEETGGDRTAY